MRKILLLSIVMTMFVFPAFGEKAENEGLVHYTQPPQMLEIKELSESEDDLYSGAEVKPLDIKISQEEKQQDLSSDLDYIDKEYELPELSCDNEKLTKQVALFIKNNTSSEESSVKKRRSRLLMIKNLNNFFEISEDDLNKQKNFKTRSMLAHLRINEKREIYKICESKNKDAGNFSDVYLIIYPYFKYYKVVVTNLVSSPEKNEDATFIYNW